MFIFGARQICKRARSLLWDFARNNSVRPLPQLERQATQGKTAAGVKMGPGNRHNR